VFLKKKHYAIAYHRVREAIAARIMRFAYNKSEENVSDVLTKPLINEKFHYLMKRWLFCEPEKDKLGSLQSDHLGNLDD
jgi:hypothetical protein